MKHLKSQESLRVLDIGPTSSTNINYITSLGHSIYMANLVEEALKPEWMVAGEDGETKFDVGSFLESNLNFSGRKFDVVILWDTADYLPESLVEPVLSRLHEVMEPGGLMLAFFHATADPAASFCRYHLTDTEMVEIQKAGSYPVVQIYSNRKVETLLKDYSAYRFFLAKDNLREVIVTR
ncbi:MAG: class I SAM-dependent methyltransferase [Edaphobacter sp.]|uniref:methyltransferase domain-containing protein n=1 Tax=Edaphobacter sp. TaxID=1934404 RepID=UPI0023A4578A|nr:class I SAM-dependent methyltransferase [Edaphobacter sp.]MDE1175449.1 class I SAM-dependent methyltransferase [Edaphobacter sp.]